MRTILDLGFTKSLPLEEVRSIHDYELGVQREHSDVVFGLWLQIHPQFLRLAAGVPLVPRAVR